MQFVDLDTRLMMGSLVGLITLVRARSGSDRAASSVKTISIAIVVALIVALND